MAGETAEEEALCEIPRDELVRRFEAGDCDATQSIRDGDCENNRTQYWDAVAMRDGESCCLMACSAD